MGVATTSACISNEKGNLLYYTNGCYINDITGNVLLNGDSISPCAYTYQEYYDGLSLPEATLFLPKPADTNYYYLFDLSLDSTDYHPGNLYYNLIDKRGNGGLGAVVKKNIILFNSAILRAGGITACKHANGRDYWIVIGESNTNGFYKFLLTPDTILGPFIQNIGPVFPNLDDYGIAKFSQDGSKYVTGIYGYGPILVMDFDRCSGEFSNPDTVYNEASTDPIHRPLSGCAAVEFSPNGRFIYVSDVINLNQYDLRSGNIQDSIAVYTADSNDFFEMDMVQLAPNGKIYASTWNGGLQALHVVNYPDSLGASCGFVYGGQPILTLTSGNIPNLINYNLGPLVGSGCDTIPDSPALIKPLVENNLLRIMPNPADKYLYVEMGMQGNYEFQLLNEMGQLIDTKETRQVDDFDTERLANGIYFLKAIDKSNPMNSITKKVVIAH
jgi:hypothetical protein